MYSFVLFYSQAYKRCDFDYLLKTDDDTLVHIPNLYTLIAKSKKTGVYLGRAQSQRYNDQPFREDRYGLSYEEYAGKFLPPFVTGGGVLFSHDVVKGVIPHFVKRLLKLEDVYVGLLVMNMNIIAQHSNLFGHSVGECEWEKWKHSVTLHFWGRKKRDEITCMRDNFKHVLQGLTK